MNLKDLNKEMPYKWRVQSFSKFKAQGQCVAYIDARDAQKRLDEVCGKENWQALYYNVGTMLFCKVGIKIGDEWVWKSDTGSESNIEKEKGHSSDAFKRACVLWGIGRFLYDLDIKYVKANEKKTNSNFPHVIDNNGNRVWDLTKHLNSNKPQPKVTLMTEAQKTIFKNKIQEIEPLAENKEFYVVANALGISNETTTEKEFKDIWAKETKAKFKTLEDLLLV